MRPLPALTKRDQIAALSRLGVDVAAQGTCQAPTLHVRLDMGRAHVPGRGHVDLIRFSHVFSAEPRADWFSWLDVEGSGGYVDLWLDGLTAGRTYILDIAVTGFWRGGGSAVKVSSSAGFSASFPTPQILTLQHLTGLLTPDSDQALVALEPVELDGLSFHSADFYLS